MDNEGGEARLAEARLDEANKRIEKGEVAWKTERDDSEKEKNKLEITKSSAELTETDAEAKVPQIQADLDRIKFKLNTVEAQLKDAEAQQKGGRGEGLLVRGAMVRSVAGFRGWR
ncbi:hypothetical protein BVRB_6g144840 [Beta vulgaris subsp. vulgaris]|nr:hypothetical protein BVRB_6g144840 [Beta vulgaris subsp. vulgaris]